MEANGAKIRLKKVLIVSTDLHEENMLKSVPQNEVVENLQIESTGSFGQEPTWWAQHAPDILIINLPDEEPLQNYFFSKLKTNVPKNQGILILSKNVSTSLMQLSGQFQKLRILKAPISATNLYKSIIDVVTSRETGKQQIHPRYMTDQDVTVTSDLKAGKMSSKMKNLSLTGAYIESAANTIGLVIGDLVRIQIYTHNRKEYVFDGRVVWVKAPDGANFIGFGITFVDKEEVYNNLLKGF